MALVWAHRLVCAGVASLVSRSPEIRLVGEANDGPEAMALVLATGPDVVVLDFQLLASNAPPDLAAMRASPSRPRIVLLSTPADHDSVLEALRDGAWGVVSKDAPLEELIRSIRAAARGEAWLNRDTVSHLLESIHGRSADGPRPRLLLTPRELDIVREVAQGSSNADIGRKLAVTGQTVKNRLSGIFDKLGVSSRLELALYAVSHDVASMRAEAQPARRSPISPRVFSRKK